MCKDKIGKTKCNLCNKDLCKDCVTNMNITINQPYQSNIFGDIGIVFCNDCYLKLIDAHLKNKNFFDDFMIKQKKDVLDYIKKNLILENLKDEKRN